MIHNKEKSSLKNFVLDFLKSGAIARLGGGVVCYMTVLPGHSQENLPNPLAAHLYSAGWGVPVFLVSSSLSHGPKEDAASRHLANKNGRDLSPL